MCLSYPGPGGGPLSGPFPPGLGNRSREMSSVLNVQIEVGSTVTRATVTKTRGPGTSQKAASVLQVVYLATSRAARRHDVAGILVAVARELDPKVIYAQIDQEPLPELADNGTWSKGNYGPDLPSSD